MSIADVDTEAAQDYTATSILLDRAQAVEALRAVVAATTGTRGSLPILASALVETNGHLAVTATNLDLRLTYDAELDAPGCRFAVPAVRLLRALTQARGPEVVASVGSETVTVDSDGRAVTLGLMPAEEFPRALAVEGDEFEIDEATADAIGRVAPSASRDDARPILTAVCIGEGAVVASDSYRLAVCEADVPDAVFLMPAVAAAFLPSEDDTVAVRDGQRIEWGVGPLTVNHRLIEGQFPSWRNLMPTSLPHAFTFERQAMLDALRAIEPWAKDGPTPVRLSVAHGRLALLYDPAQQSFEDVTISDSIEGDGTAGVTLAFNVFYLREGIEALLDDTATLQFEDHLKPALFAEDGFSYLLMPVRV